MANRAPSIDPVLAAIEAAPFVPATDQERELLAAARATPGEWLTTDQVLATIERMRLEEERAKH